MIYILIVEIPILIISIIGTYLSYHRPFTSPAWLNQFGVWPEKSVGNPKYLNEARTNALISEVTRSVVLVVGSAIIIYLFTISTGNIISFLSSKVFQVMFSISLIISIAWCVILGPIKFASVQGTKYSFREHSKPYLIYFLYIAAIWAGLGSLTGVAIFEGVRSDLGNIRISDQIISVHEISSPEHTLDQENFLFLLQRSTIELISFGRQIASMSQKYIAAALLAMLYLIAEQQTNMRKTLLVTSVDRLKYGIWVIMLISLFFGVVYLPGKYADIHKNIQMFVENDSLDIVKSNETEDVMNLLGQLESHGLRWLAIEILTGYANIIAFIVIGGSLWIRQVLFKNIPVNEMLELFLPKPIYNILSQYTKQIGFEFKDKGSHTRDIK